MVLTMRRERGTQRATVQKYISAVGIVAAFTALGLVVFPYATSADLAMMYLVAIALASLFGRGPSMLASTLSVLAFDFCFIPPRFTLSVEHPTHLFTFAVMFAAGLVISTLTERLRRRERRA
jgi:two-component system, OmpR family, sensor histidine kinase KdpD